MRTFLLSGTILLAATASVLAEDATGEWLVEDKSARIKIVNCQNALWGVMWAEKSPGFDTGNRDPSMKGRPMLGIPLVVLSAAGIIYLMRKLSAQRQQNMGFSRF